MTTTQYSLYLPNGTQLQSPPPTPPEGSQPPEPPHRRRRWVLPVVGAAALVIGAGGGAAIGHVAWPNAPVFEAAPATTATPTSNNSGNGSSSGSGNGSGNGFGDGSGGGSGNEYDGGAGGQENVIPPFLLPFLPGGQEGNGSGSGSGAGGQGEIPQGGGTFGGGGNLGQGNLGGGSGDGGQGEGSYQPGTITSAPGAPSNVATIAKGVDKAVVDINDLFGYQQAAGAGTGIVLTKTGLVLTNNHVIDGATSIQATDQGNGKTYTATVVGYDPTDDIALLQLKDASGLTTATIGNSSGVTVGESIVGIGNAEGVGGTPSAAGGSVTALDQSVTVGDDMYGTTEHLTGLMQVNADILPGDSGGPLVTKSGAVIGVDTAAAQGQASANGDYEGEAIPINHAMAIVKQIESGHGTSAVHVGATAALGVLVPSSGSESQTPGAAVGGVISGGAAAKAGLAEGDVITSVGGHTIASSATLQQVMLGYHPGQKVTIGWSDTEGTAHHATVTLGSGPAA